MQVKVKLSMELVEPASNSETKSPTYVNFLEALNANASETPLTQPETENTFTAVGHDIKSYEIVKDSTELTIDNVFELYNWKPENLTALWIYAFLATPDANEAVPVPLKIAFTDGAAPDFNDALITASYAITHVLGLPSNMVRLALQMPDVSGEDEVVVVRIIGLSNKKYTP